MEPFLIIIYDDDNLFFDIMEMSNDELLTNNVAMLQRNGFNVHCHSANKNSFSVNEKNINGYNREENLYYRLLLDYERKTGKVAKRW